MFKKQIFIVTFLVVAFLLPLPALAFSVSPIKYTLNIDPGSSQIAVINVINDQAQPAKFNFSVSGVKQDKLGRTIVQSGIDAAEEWVKSEVTSAMIEPGEQKKINFIISVPVGASPGEHDVALVAEQAASSSGHIGISARLSVLVALRVAGVVTESVGVTDFILGRTLVFNKQKIDFNLFLKNFGTVAAPVSGGVNFTNWLGQDFGNQDLYLGNSLFPQSSRQLSLSAPAEGWFWPGRYSANVTVSYGTTKLITVARASVWYFPIWSIIVLAGLAASVIISLKKLSGRKSL